MQIRSRAALAAALAGTTFLGLALSACAPGSGSSDADSGDTIHIVGFAVPAWRGRPSRGERLGDRPAAATVGGQELVLVTRTEAGHR